MVEEAERFEPEPGKVYDGLLAEAYHAAKGISKSGLDLIARSPMHYDHARRHPKPATAAQAGGTAFHTLVLEPERFNAECVLIPDNAPKTPSAMQLNAANPSPATVEAIEWWTQFDTTHAGKTKIKRELWDNIHAMRDAVMQHSDAPTLLS